MVKQYKFLFLVYIISLYACTYIQNTPPTTSPPQLSTLPASSTPSPSPTRHIHENTYEIIQVDSLLTRYKKGTLYIHNPSIDQFISKTLYQTHTWEPETVNFMRRILWQARQHNKNAVFVDVGANIGYFSLIAALNDFSVISIEPVVYNLNLLYKTHKANGNPTHWIIKPMAASNTTGTAISLKHVSSRDNASNFKTNVNGTEHTTTIKLDDMDIEYIGLLKLDVEGHELHVLDGAKRMLKEKRIHAIVMEYSTIGLRLSKNVLKKHGFKQYSRPKENNIYYIVY